MKLFHILFTIYYFNAALSREVETEDIEGSGMEDANNEKKKDFASDVISRIDRLEETLNSFIHSFKDKKIAFLEETINKLITSGNGASQSCERRHVDTPDSDIPDSDSARIATLKLDYEAQMDAAKVEVNKCAQELRDEIDAIDAIDLDDDGKRYRKAKVTLNEEKVCKGFDGGKKGFEKIASKVLQEKSKVERDKELERLDEIVNGKKEPTSDSDSRSTSASTSGSSRSSGSGSTSGNSGSGGSGSTSGGTRRTGEKVGAVIGAVSTSLPNIKKVLNPSLTWQARTSAGFDIAAKFTSLLPAPVGIIGSAIFSLVGACFAVTAPTTKDYRELRDQILAGIKNILDDVQEAEAMGCLYKIEFLKGILEMHDDDASTLMTKDEFFAVILAGGVDIGVATLGIFKHQMEKYRDENTIFDGRRALDFAHFYVKVARHRDMLNKQILTYITISGGDGFTNRFFENTNKLSHMDYQYLFFWEETCCEKKNEKYFSALVAYNLPIRRHTGAGNAVAEVSEFVNEFRTDKYYEDDYNGINADTRLSYDEMVNGKYRRVERPPQVDDEYYRYKSYNNGNYYLGKSTSRIGYRKERVGTRADPNWKVFPHNIHAKECGPNNYIARFGVTGIRNATFHFQEDPDVGEPRAATILLRTTTDSYSNFITTASAVNKKDTDLNTYTGTTYKTTAIIRPKDARDMMVACAGYRAWNSLPRLKVRVFHVKMNGWNKGKFLISPLARLSESDDKLYLINSDSTFSDIQGPTHKYVEIPIDLSNPAPPLTADELIKSGSNWRKLWFEKESYAIPNPQNEAYLVKSKVCWNECHDTGYCPQFCGTDGWCCRKNYDADNCPSTLDNVADTGGHKCVIYTGTANCREGKTCDGSNCGCDNGYCWSKTPCDLTGQWCYTTGKYAYDENTNRITKHDKFCVQHKHCCDGWTCKGNCGNSG